LRKSAPDFDLFVTGLTDPRAYMCDHRAHTHSLFIEALYAIPIAWLLVKLFKQKVSFKRLCCFFTSLFVGSFVIGLVYQLWHSIIITIHQRKLFFKHIAIVDLLFTLPMLILVVIAVFYKKNETRRYKLSRATLIYCFAYLGLTFINKVQANSLVEDSID
jgi:inner membrane protein